MTTELATVANDAQLAVLTQRTPPDQIRWRDGKGGGKLAYVDHAYVTRTLNEAFGWDWDFEADNEEILYNRDVPFEVRCRGKLTVRLQGRSIVKMQFGCQPIEMKRDGSAPVSLGDAFKGAASDALKKCASLLGIALDLYDSDDQPERPRAQGGASYQPQQRQQAPVTRQPMQGATPRVGVPSAAQAAQAGADELFTPRTEAAPVALSATTRATMVTRIREHMRRAQAFGFTDAHKLAIDLESLSDLELLEAGKVWKARADELVAKDAAAIPA